MNAGPSSKLQDQQNNRLVAEALTCVRGDKMLFRNLDFALEPGQAGLLTGPNGVGKSSLLRLVAGLLQPFSGEVRYPSTKALCDDRLSLDESLTLQTALKFWAQLDNRFDDHVSKALIDTGLPHLAEVPVRYFSTGQRQRARLARTILSDAKLWLLDEPANGLDIASVEQLGQNMQSHLDVGGIILAASHIPLPIAFELTLKLEPLEQLEAIS